MPCFRPIACPKSMHHAQPLISATRCIARRRVAGGSAVFPCAKRDMTMEGRRKPGLCARILAGGVDDPADADNHTGLAVDPRDARGNRVPRFREPAEQEPRDVLRAVDGTPGGRYFAATVGPEGDVVRENGDERIEVSAGAGRDK